MKKVKMFLLHSICFLSLLVMFAFSGGKYDWMSEVDHAIPKGSINDSSDNRIVFLTVVLGGVLMVQMFMFLKTKCLAEKVFCIVFSLAAIGIYMHT
ncbi:hypothetical protein ACIPMZ_22455 [Scandinavium goeteborgense]|uniref:hypothetical protein n=1 Tax=Scandinavium goeteborgense TaxID=1851514 RepID=UPI0037F7F5A4